MEEDTTDLATRECMEASMAEIRRVQALLEAERAQVRRVRRIQKLWWWAVFLLGAAFGFMLAEKFIDPVTILLPPTGIDV
jgi:hypothetical protein